MDLGSEITQKLSKEFIRVVPQGSRNRVAGETARGFESHPLRQKSLETQWVQGISFLRVVRPEGTNPRNGALHHKAGI